MSSNTTQALMEAYSSIYQIEDQWEDVENWVNSLIEEGYDLSDYTWEEMYREYLQESPTGLVGFDGKPLKVSSGARRAYDISMNDSKFQNRAARQYKAKGGKDYSAYLASGKNRPDPFYQTSGQIAGRERQGRLAISARNRINQQGGFSGLAKAEPNKDSARFLNTLGNVSKNSQKPSVASVRNTSGVLQDVTVGKRYSGGKAGDFVYDSSGNRKVVPKESFDLFDVIGGYLLDEGYADCLGSAEIIFENMSEEWMDGILEEVLNEKLVDPFRSPSNTYNPERPSGMRGRLVDPLQSRSNTYNPERPDGMKGRLVDPLKGGNSRRKTRKKSKVQETYDLIVEYLIQEGYANSLGSAEIIIENMSEEWLEEILNEEKDASYDVALRRSGLPRDLKQAASWALQSEEEQNARRKDRKRRNRKTSYFGDVLRSMNKD